jgi:hypothetical protein
MSQTRVGDQRVGEIQIAKIGKVAHTSQSAVRRIGQVKTQDLKGWQVDKVRQSVVGDLSGKQR